MKFVSTRVLRNQPGLVRDAAAHDDVVLTANGQPFAILVGVTGDDFEATAQAIRRAKAQQAVTALRSSAAKAGTAEMPLTQITAEIRKARAARKRP